MEVGRQYEEDGAKTELPEKVPGLPRPTEVIIISKRYDFMTGYKVRLIVRRKLEMKCSNGSSISMYARLG